MQVWITFNEISKLEDCMFDDVVGVNSDCQYINITYYSMTTFKHVAFNMREIEFIEVYR